MIVSESPAGARRRLRLALRRVRYERDMTQQQVADALDWSISKVNRIENGEVTVSVTDLQALLTLYRMVDDDRREDLVEAARAARKRGWWDDAKYRDNASPALLRLVQYESHATTIRVFYPSLIDGLLQTPRYSEAIFDLLSADLSSDVRVARAELRMRRQAEVLSGPHQPRVLFLLDESILLREVGGVEVLSDQLAHLLDLIDRERVVVRVLPMNVGFMMVMVGGFSVLDLDDGASSILYRELMLDDHIIEGEEVVRRYRARFDEGWRLSLGEKESRDLIEKRRGALHPSLKPVSPSS